MVGYVGASKPSSVLDGHLSRSHQAPSSKWQVPRSFHYSALSTRSSALVRGRLPRRLGSCSRLPTGSASHLSRLLRDAAVASEIAAGRIALFTPPACAHGIGLGCSRPPKRAPIWTVRTHDRPCPRFRVAPRSTQLGLSSAHREQRPSCAAILAQPFYRV